MANEDDSIIIDDQEDEPENRELTEAKKKIANYEFQISHFITEYEKQKNLLEMELEIAKRIQMVIMPTSLDKKIPCCEAAVRTISAAEVTGDYYDIMEMPGDRIAFLVTDAVGHGIPAALLTIMAKMIISKHCTAGVLHSPSDILRVSSHELAQYFEIGYYLTGILAILDRKTGTLAVCNAGHHPGILLDKKSGDLSLLDSKGLLIGLNVDADNAVYSDYKIQLSDNQYRLIFFTDGITEAKDHRREEYGDERFCLLLKESLSQRPSQAIDSVFADLQNFTRSRVGDDDQTLMIVDFICVKNDEDYHSDREPAVYCRKLFSEAVEQAREKKYTEALQNFRRVIDHFPKNLKALTNIGIIHYKTGEYEKAAEILRNCLSNDPEFELALHVMEKVRAKMAALPR